LGVPSNPHKKIRIIFPQFYFNIGEKVNPKTNLLNVRVESKNLVEFCPNMKYNHIGILCLFSSFGAVGKTG